MSVYVWKKERLDLIVSVVEDDSSWILLTPTEEECYEIAESRANPKFRKRNLTILALMLAGF